MHRLLLYFALFICGFEALSQGLVNSKSSNDAFLDCGYQSDSASAAYRKQLIANMYAQRNKDGSIRTTNGKYKIPVVVHVIEPSKSNSLISDDEIQQGIHNLNRAFAAMDEFSGSLDVGIQFELVRYDPSCNPTTGITRYDASGLDWYVKSGLPHASVRDAQNWVDWDHSSYYNIWLISQSDVIAGAASPDLGAVIVAKFFQGTVTPHETGHYLGLGHVFPGPERGCICGDGDGLRDTPVMMPTGLTAVCDFVGNCFPEDMARINPCTGEPLGDIQKNMMNYACNEKFTPDQRNLMRLMAETYHISLLASPGLSQTKPLAIANLAGPSFVYSTRNSYGYTGLSASCVCDDKISQLTIDGREVTTSELGSFPVLQFGGSVIRTYELSCQNGSKTSKSVRYQRVGVVNIQRNCSSGSRYEVGFENTGKFKITASAGIVSENKVIDIPNESVLTLTAEAPDGTRDSITLEPPCCTVGQISNAKCLPTSTRGLDDNFGIDNVTFGNSINKTTANSDFDGSYYLDYACSEQATVSQGESYNVSVKGHADNKHFVKIYIDFDGNGDFNGVNELLLNGETSGGAANIFSGKITIPKNAATKMKLRMRVLADASPNSNACSIVGSNGAEGARSGAGQIEDYAIYVNPKVNLDHPFPDISEIIHIKVNQKPEWAVGIKPFVVPNPIEGSEFELDLPVTGSYRIKLYNRAGLPIPVSITNHEARLLISAKSKLKSGMYILKIKNADLPDEQEVRVLVK